MFCLSQKPKPDITKDTTKLEYWKGKLISYRQFRDSLDAIYFRYCDSLNKKNIKPKTKPV